MKALQLGDVGNAEKCKPSGQIIRKSEQEKSFVKKSKGLLERTYEKAEMQRKALKQRKNVVLSKDLFLEKERLR